MTVFGKKVKIKLYQVVDIKNDYGDETCGENILGEFEGVACCSKRERKQSKNCIHREYDHTAKIEVSPENFEGVKDFIKGPDFSKFKFTIESPCFGNMGTYIVSSFECDGFEELDESFDLIAYIITGELESTYDISEYN